MIPSTLIKKNNERKLLDAKSKQKQLLSEKQILKLISPEKFKLKGENYELEIKRFDLFFDSYSREGKGKPVAYMDFDEEFIYMATGDGNFFKTKIDNIQSNEFTFELIETNIKNIIKDELFYQPSWISIKDILVSSDHIFFSTNYELKKDCYNTAIFYSNLDSKGFNFKNFFIDDTCVPKNNPETNKEWNAHQSGGRFLKDKDDQETLSFYFSTGEYRNRKLAQLETSYFGKILKFKINKSNNTTMDNNPQNFSKPEIISIGHRNPQGLIFIEGKDKILSSEHGPLTGDEINLIDLNNDKIENFGWPIASYGKHYNSVPDQSKIEFNFKDSHSAYGFKEPAIFFTERVAPSQLMKLSENTILLTTLNYKNLLFFDYDKKLGKLELNEKIYINERLRDIIFLENKNLYIYISEIFPSLNVMKLN